MARPLIGITPDAGTTLERPGRPALPRYELKQNYIEAIVEAGGTPLILPYLEDDDAIEQVVQLCQGLVVSGGGFDVPPAFYGAEPHPQLGPLNPQRSRFEQRVVRKALARDLPILGVCGGMQILAVELGATLVQDLPSEAKSDVDHEQKFDPREPAHDVRILPRSLLARVTGVEAMRVNSTHHQAVKTPGRTVPIAHAADGSVEAIELRGAKFVLGVQWHPELMRAPEHRAIYRGVVEAAGG
ncbi:MAG: gamma-glutamyl-gamma-aminobutyrate hydrolase family protein [Deltaproteobacteria bacterium]|nr:gamma-glutamyl-gamma-aminobutyrate hydrolase family protein [Deltaproteobacteria bacterium]